MGRSKSAAFASAGKQLLCVAMSGVLALGLTPVTAFAARGESAGAGPSGNGALTALSGDAFTESTDVGEGLPYRILARGADANACGGVVLSSDGENAIIGYSDEKLRNDDVRLLGSSAAFAVPNTAFAAAEGTSAAIAEAHVDDASVFDDVKAPAASYDVAVIDTAVSTGSADASMSVLGENVAHATRHGDAMCRFVREHDPHARILSIEALDASGTGSVATVYAAMCAAIDARVKVINLSLSARSIARNAALEDAVAQAWAAGIIVVGSAGNDGASASWYVPGNIGSAVVAGSCNAEGVRLESSNYGSTVDALVVSESTSEAAALMSGWLSANSTFETHLDDIRKAIEAGVFFECKDVSDDADRSEGDSDFHASAWVPGTSVTTGTYFIKAKSDSSKALEAASLTAASTVTLKAYSASDRKQQWHIEKTSNGTAPDNAYKILLADKPSLGIRAVAYSNGSLVKTAAYSSSNGYFKWGFDQNGSTFVFPNGGSQIGRHYWRVMDVDTGTGTKVQLWDRTCGGTSDATEYLKTGKEAWGSSVPGQQFTLTRAYYQVKFNGNGATSGSMNNQKVWIDSPTPLAANAFTRAYKVTYNYNGSGKDNTSAIATATLNGWATSASGAKSYNNKASVENLTTTHDATVNLYANWTLGEVTLPTPTRTGYTFAGWYTAASGGTKVGAGGASYKPTAATTLYAHWKVNTFAVKYAANGGDSAPDAQTKTYGEDLELRAGIAHANTNPATYTVTYNYNGSGAANTTAVSKVTRKWTFSKWKASDGTLYSAKGTYKKNEATTMTAQWTTSDSNPSVKLPAPSRPGYTFAGWYTASSGGTKVGVGGGSYTPSKNITLYARWTINGYKLSVDPSGGTWSGSSSVQSFTQNYNTTKTIANPVRTGYSFSGWTKGGAGSLSGTTWTFGAGNGSLTAKWTANSYSVKYNGNGATSGTMANSIHTYDASKALTSNAFGRTHTVTFNYNGSGAANTTASAAAKFTGWAKTATGAKAYDDKASVKNLTGTNGAVVNLYATWALGSVTLPAPKREGYTFGGWYKEASCKNKAQENNKGGASYAVSANVTLYAKWNANDTYVVDYNGNGATGGETPSSTHVFDVPATLTPNGFVRAHTVTFDLNYPDSTDLSATATAAFDGWATSASGARVYADKDSVKNLASGGGETFDLYAVWKLGKVVLPAPKRSGYAFGGWYRDPACQDKVGDGSAEYTPSADETLYAKWEDDLHTVMFEANEGDGSMRPRAGRDGELFTIPDASFTRAGYRFTHWLDQNGDKRSVGDAITLNSDVTLSAQWEPLQITFSVPVKIPMRLNADMSISADVTGAYAKNESEVRLDITGLKYADDGRFNLSKNPSGPGDYELLMQVANGAKVTLADYAGNTFKEVPVEEGSKAQGWALAPGEALAIEEISGHMASINDFWHDEAHVGVMSWRFAPVLAKISFNAGGGSGVVASQAATVGTRFAAPECTFENDGKKFAGWKDESGASYEEGDVIEVSGDLVFTATWE